MMVVDASAMLEMLLQTSRSEEIEEHYLREKGFCAPHLLDLEVAQVLRRYCAAGELSSERAREALLDLQDLGVYRYPHRRFLDRIWELRANVTAYDAVYLALAEVLSAPLLTCDARLVRSPGHDVNFVYQP